MLTCNKHFMKIFLTTTFGLFLLCSTIFAQMQWPQVYEIKDDTAYWQHITPEHWVMLEDKAGKWTFDEVLALADKGMFHSVKTSYDSLANTYWIAYKLQNTMNREARVSLNSMSNTDEFYVQKDSMQWEHFTSGKLNETPSFSVVAFSEPLKLNSSIMLFTFIPSKVISLNSDLHA